MADLLTNAQLAQLINDALSKWNAREAEQYAWVSGSATGGPNGDGRYPLSNGSGGSSLIDSPAKLADLLNGPAALAGAARDAALTFRDAAESAATAASTDKALANNHKLAAQDARDLAAQYRNEIAALLPGFNANASMVQAASLAVAADVDLMEALLEEGYVARDAAVTAQTAAEAAAALAATFNPNDYYTKVAADGRYLQLTNFTWANLSGKPSTFTPSAHTHLISEITGLQAALDGKQAAGSYAAAVHTHDYLPLTGGTLTGGLAVAGDVTASRSSTEGVLYLSSSGSKYLRYGDGVYGLAGADLYINGNLAWHGGNFNPASKADVDHTHNSTTGDHTVSGNLYLGNTDGSNLNAFRLDVYANDLAIVASSGAGAPAGTSISFRTATAGGGETERMRINPDGIVGLSVGLTVQGNPVWHSGNFDPNSKLSTSGGTMTGTLSMSSSPIVMAFNGSLPYLDMQTTGVSGGRNYRIRSGIEGVSNAGFSIKDLTSDTNVLSIDGSGALYTGNAKFVHKSNFGYSSSYKTVVLGGEYLTTVSLGYDPSANASGSFNGNGEGREVLFRNGVSFLTPNAANNSYHLTLNMADGKVGVGTTSPITSLDTVGDITARGGNIYVRENPSGAGAGMRLHHSGGGAYIDFDGDLNFRNGEGSQYAAVRSDGWFAANSLWADNTSRAGVPGTSGSVQMQQGGANPGYLSWHTPAGTRVGYMGWAEGSNIVYQAEAGWGLKFNVGTTQFGGDMMRVHDPASGASVIRITQPGVDDMIAVGRMGNAAGALSWLPAHMSYIYTSGGVLRIGGGGSGYTELVNGSAKFTGDITAGTLTGYNSPTALHFAGDANWAYGCANEGSDYWMQVRYYGVGDTTRGFRVRDTSNNTDTFQVAPSRILLNTMAAFAGQVNISGGNLRINSGGDDSAMGAYVGFRNSVNGERGWIGYGEGNSRMRVNNSIGSVWVSGTDVQLVVNNAGSSARVATAYGYLDLGPLNSSWCHYNTDRPAHYFNTAVHVNGAIMRYNEGAALHHGSSSMGSGRITTSTAAPSGGSDGDVWFKVAS